MTIGILAYILVGNKNQKKPTQIVKYTGSTKARSVIFLPKASLNDQTKSSRVNNPSPAMLSILNLSSTN